MKTWQVELIVVGNLLAVVGIQTARPENYYAELIGALAVVLTFAHVQVADRLAERAAADEWVGVQTVECHRWARRYLLGKEICWLLYFVALGAWSALVGVGVFLFYPFWRSYYRKWRPLRALKESE